MKINQRFLLNMTGILTIVSVILPCPVRAYDSQDLLVDSFQHLTSISDFIDRSVRPWRKPYPAYRTLIVKSLTNQGLTLLEELRDTDKNFLKSIVRLRVRSSVRIRVSYTGEIAVLLSVQPKRAIALESLIMSLAVILVMLAAMLLILLGLTMALVVVLSPSKQSILL